MQLVPFLTGSDTPRSPANVLILGSTGSIGCSALEIVRMYPQHFNLFGLVAGSSHERLLQQALEFKPRYAVLANSERTQTGFPCELLCGAQAACDLAQSPEVDLVVAGIVGMAGLAPVLSALQAGKKVALANKESLVCAGELIRALIKKHGGTLLPVDSEHSALWQLLQGQELSKVEKLILTASGGPFLTLALSELAKVTPQQAAAHPRWNMGAKISVDSATLVNKGLELIEAHYLFGFEAERIDVLIHPQSIVHSLVSFRDGAQLAQLSNPDMKGPISYAMNYPHGRLAGAVQQLDLATVQTLHFQKLDEQRFPAVSLAKRSLRTGGAAPAVFNIANELAVSRFLKGKLTFDRLFPMVEMACERFAGRVCGGLDELFALQAEIERAFPR